MFDRRCSACGGEVPAESETCPRDGVTFAPVSLFGVRMDEPSLAELATYTAPTGTVVAPVRLDVPIDYINGTGGSRYVEATVYAPPAVDGFATVPLSEEWS